MINSKQILNDFIEKIDARFGEGEIMSVANFVIESVFKLSRQQSFLGADLEPLPEQIHRLEDIANRLNRDEPVQYILNEAYFYNRKFFVDRSVLIPRPETEELVSVVIDTCYKSGLRKPTIVDIGTGSGCIAITLALEMPSANVEAMDISEDALRVAKKNAKALGAKVHFEQRNFLENPMLPTVEILVSNPPYIAASESKVMSANVLDFEPHVALFVADNDPLIFYRKIAMAAETHLRPGGFVAVEINERFGDKTCELFRTTSFRDSHVIKDISGKDRIVIAHKR